ncbi:MAG: DUF4837 family protein [Bacteroidota bacterium]
MNLKHIKHIGIAFLLSILLYSCSQEARSQLRPTPNAYGPRNQLVVVMDDELWKGDVGDTVRYYYGSAYPILPQPEPIFDLTHFTPKELEEDGFRKELRNFLFVADLSEESSPTTQMLNEDLGSEKIRAAKEDVNASTTVAKDRWAKEQLMIFVYSDGKETLKDQLIKTFPAAKKRIDKANSDKIESNVYVSGENGFVNSEVQESMSLGMRIPKPFIIAYDEQETIWLRRETPVSSSNIMIHKQPYQSTGQITRENLKSIQDSLGKKLVSTDIDGTYMRINDVDLPMLTETIELNGNYALEARGIWDIVNDYAGGPFVSYLTVNPKTNELIYINAFVHAPGEEKREFMQNLEHIVSTIQF